uniref:Cadherin domain-containing protein n=1 Tax=Latimeria chalumnae TaxID=7897 RepID=H3BGE2_LATCH
TFLYCVSVTGDLTLSYPLDYEDTTIPHSTVLQIRAYDNDRVHSTTAKITVDLTDSNDNPPQCNGYFYFTQLAETTPIGTLVKALNCWDNDLTGPNNAITYTMVADKFSANKFQLTKNQITVIKKIVLHNVVCVGPENLEYDDLAFAGTDFVHRLAVTVSDGGIPSLESVATIIIKVIPVNEWRPNSVANTFTVLENSVIGTLVGTVKFTDTDWPFNNVKYSITGGDIGIPPKFYIDPATGNIQVLHKLDFETETQYSMKVQAVDLNNDLQPDPKRQKTSVASVIVNILNVNDEPPVCNPEYYETLIYSTIKTPFLQLKCNDKDSLDREINYVIIAGNVNNRFELQRPNAEPPSVATTQSFQYHVFQGIQDPTDFELLIEVTDELDGNKALRQTSTATVIIHVVPWTTTQATTTLNTTTVQITTSVIVRASYFWTPTGWFVAALVITGVLLLLCLYGVAWCLFKDMHRICC